MAADEEVRTHHPGLRHALEADEALHSAVFRRFLAARTLMMLGRGMTTVAAAWLVYDATGNATAVAALAFLSLGPSIVGGVVGGWLADRFGPRRVALALLVGRLVPATIIAVLALDGEITVAQLFVLVGLSAVFAGPASPVLSSLAADAVPEGARRTAVADSALSYELAKTGGPGIGGLLVGVTGIAPVFLMALPGIVLMIYAVLRLPRDAVRAPRQDRPRHESALSAVRTSSLLVSVVLSVVIFFALVGPLERLAPVLADAVGGGAAAVGILISAVAIGGLVGNGLVRRLMARDVPPQVVQGGALVLAGLATLALGMVDSLLFALVLMAFIGVAQDGVWVSSQDVAQFRSPEGTHGLVVGLVYSAVSAATAIGSLLLGAAVERAGHQFSLASSGALAVVLGVGALMLARLRSEGVGVAEEERPV